MKFLPAENSTYRTKLKEDEVIKRLSDFIEPEKTFRFRRFSKNSAKPYEGQISGLTFDIKRIINYRNSFLPRIKGVIQRDFDGTTIKIKMRLHLFVAIFLGIWCGVMGLGCFAFLIQAISSSSAFNPATLIPFGMLLLTYALTIGGFNYESAKSKKDLQALFKADIVAL